MNEFSLTQKPTNTSNGSITEIAAAYTTREIKFRYRQRDYSFALSHGLFSSAGIDDGSKFLLKVFSSLLDENHFNLLPQSILDAGCGIGVLGICAAGALTDIHSTGKYSASLAQTGSAEKHSEKFGKVDVSVTSRIAVQSGCTLTGAARINDPGCFSASLRIYAQDRDELARVFTLYNAKQNGFTEDMMSAHTEPLLSSTDPFDLILSNVPAKAGIPVLEDFVHRSISVLNPGGKVLIVAVNTLAEFFTEKISEAAILHRQVKGTGHTVFLYGDRGTAIPDPQSPVPDPLLKWNPAYLRNSASYELEKISYQLTTIHGAESFDSPGAHNEAAAKLAVRLESEIRSCFNMNSSVLVFEGDQGHFPVWLTKKFICEKPPSFILAGRNILALETAKDNIFATLMGTEASELVSIISAVDLAIEAGKIQAMTGGAGFSFIAAFPKTVPQTNRIPALWDGFCRLSHQGTVILVSLPSGEAENFDRKKPKGFSRLGDIKKKGFRALAYRKTD